MNNYDFIFLCQDGTPDEVIAAINSGADPNASMNFGRTALLVACNANNTEIVKILLNAGADPNAKDDEGWTALMSVVDKDEVDIEIIKMLIKAGADVNAKNKYDTTPLLRTVCWNNRPDIVKILLDNGADMYAWGAIGFDDFEYGCECPVEASIGKLKLLKIFLDYGADINRRYTNGQSLLTQAAGCYHSLEIVKFLLDNGADVNLKSNENLTALINAAKHETSDTEKIVNILLDAGADPNVKYENLYALDYAQKNRALQGTEVLKRLERLTNIPEFHEKISQEEFEQILEYGSIERIKDAINAGADLHKTDNDVCKENPMIFTLRRRPEYEIIKLLLDSGINANEVMTEKDSLYEGVTFLMVALTEPQNYYFKRSDYDVVKLLIDYGANVNAKLKNGCTVLMRAASSNTDKEIIKLLLDNGAKINEKDDEGKTALINACHTGNYEVIKMFIDAGADVKATTNDGATVLSELLSNLGGSDINRAMESVKLLLSKGADVNSRSKDYRTYVTGGGDVFRTPLMITVNCGRRYFYIVGDDGYGHEIAGNPLPDFVKILLDAGANIDDTDTEGYTALMFAVKAYEPDLSVIELLLDYGADVNIARDGLRAVDYARRNKKLIGTDIFKRLESMTEPLGYKRKVGFEEILDLIHGDLIDELKSVIADGADVNMRDKKGNWTLLMSAIRSDEPNLEAIKILLDAGANINEVEEAGETALKKAIYNYYNDDTLKLIKMLIDYGAYVNIPNHDGETPLIHAARFYNSDVVKVLIDAGADVNFEYKGLRALDYAYGNENMRNTNILKKLEVITAARDSNYKFSDETFAEICQIGSLTQIKKALDAGANVDARSNIMERTMLMEAVDDHDNVNKELIKLLIDYGADVNASCDDESLLLLASYNPNLGLDVFKMLFEAGVDIQKSDNCSRSDILSAASHYQPIEVIKFLFEKGLTGINKQDQYGRTPLMYAVWHGNFGVAELFLDNGADIAIKDNNGDTAADYYRRSRRSYTKDDRFLKKLQIN